MAQPIPAYDVMLAAREPLIDEIKTMLDMVGPSDLTSVEVLGLAAALRPAYERLLSGQLPAFRALKLCPLFSRLHAARCESADLLDAYPMETWPAELAEDVVALLHAYDLDEQARDLPKAPVLTLVRNDPAKAGWTAHESHSTTRPAT